MFEPTDEMVNLAADMLPGLNIRVAGDLRAAMRQVLTIVLVEAERDLKGQADLRCPAQFTRCELMVGHDGNHRNGDVRWWWA